MVLHRQILFTLAIAAIAEEILMRISAEQVPSLHKVAPRYLKLVISSNFWPFLLISSLMLFVLSVIAQRWCNPLWLTGLRAPTIVIALLFSVLTSIPYVVALSTSMLVRS